MQSPAHMVSMPKPFPPEGASDGEWVAWTGAFEPSIRLGIRCVDLPRGGGTFVVEEDPFVPNPNGAINGGIVAAIADNVLGVALARILAAGHTPRTGSLQVQYHRPVRTPVTVHVTVLPGGRRVQFLEAAFVDASGERCASAQAVMTSVAPQAPDARIS